MAAQSRPKALPDIDGGSEKPIAMGRAALRRRRRRRGRRGARTGRRARGPGREHGTGGGHQGPVADPEVDALGRAERDVVAVGTEVERDPLCGNPPETVAVSSRTTRRPGRGRFPAAGPTIGSDPHGHVFRRPKLGTWLYVLPV
jgi:hypothetical protein